MKKIPRLLDPESDATAAERALLAAVRPRTPDAHAKQRVASALDAQMRGESGQVSRPKREKPASSG